MYAGNCLVKMCELLHTLIKFVSDPVLGVNLVCYKLTSFMTEHFQQCNDVMHQYGILLIIRLADIIIHILADTDNRSFPKFHMNLIKCSFQKHTFWSAFYENSTIMVIQNY